MFDFNQLTTSKLQDAQAAISKLLEVRESTTRRKAAEAVVNAINDYMADYGVIKCYVRNDFTETIDDGYNDMSAASYLESITYADFNIMPDGTLEFKIDVE